MSTAKCETEDCLRPVSCRKLCKFHYEINRRRGIYPKRIVIKTCTVDGCGRKHMGRGLCHYHYRAKFSRLYDTWYQMVQRCNNPTHPEFKRYGARGIRVCDKWDGPNGYKNFMGDMSPRPDGKSLDRIDNNLGYGPDNCRWASATVQSINQRTRPDNALGITGVYYDKARKQYSAEIKFNGRRLHLGRFGTLIEAVAVRQQAESKYHAMLQ